MKPLILAIICLLPICLAGMGDAVPDLDDDQEIPLYYSYEDYLIRFYEELAEAMAGSRVSLRLVIEPDKQELYAYSRQKYLNLRLRVSQEDGEPRYSFEIREQRQDKRLEMQLGSYRYHFGLGLVTGNGGRQIASMGSSGHPNYYYPRGMAIRISNSSLEGGAWLSSQARVATIKDDLVSSLPRKKNDGLIKTTEQIMGLYLGKQSRYYGLGTLFFIQDYDRDFGNGPAGDLQLFSLAGSLTLGAMGLQAETALANGLAATKLVCEYQEDKTRQKIVLSRGSAFAKSAYASNLHSLTSNPEGWEIRHSFNHQISPRISYGLAYSVHRFRDSFISPKYLSHMQLKLGYQDSLSVVNMQVQRIDREILSLADSSFVSTRPHHWRIRTDVKHLINQSLSLRFGISYHFEERSSYSNNAFWWSAIMNWHRDPFEQSLRLQSWQTMRNLYVMETDIDGMDYAVSESSKDTLLLSWRASYSYKRWQIGLSAGLSILDQEAEDLRLWLEYR